MSTAHTPGPWRVDTDDPFVVVAGDGFSICDATAGNPLDVSNEDAIANARRIVACVNACEGVPQSVLESIAANGSFGNGIWTAMKQRDELAAALRYLVRLCDDGHLGVPVSDGRAMLEEIVGRVEFARAALAKLPSEDSANGYADSMIRRDKLDRDKGRADQDRDPGGRPLKGAP